MNKISLALLISCAAWLGGCGGSAKTYYYTLQPAGLTEQRAPGKIESIAITSLRLPELVDRPQLVLRQGDTQVDISDNHQWAQSLKSEILDSLSRLLAQESGARRVSQSGQLGAGDAQIKVAVEITRFESIPGKEAILEAKWKIQGKGDAPAKTGQTLVRKPATGTAPYDALVTAHRQALTQLAREIAAGL